MLACLHPLPVDETEAVTSYHFSQRDKRNDDDDDERASEQQVMTTTRGDIPTEKLCAFSRRS